MDEIISALTEQEQALQVKNSSEHYNLAQDLDQAQLALIGREIHDGFKSDEESRTDWLEQHTFWLSLYMQQDYAENSDQERDWGATESLPILTESCDQFQTRTYKTFFPQDTFVSAVAMRKTPQNRRELEARAKRVGDHMSYQLGYKDKSYKSDKDSLFLGVAVHGSFFTKTYYSEKHKGPKVDNIRPTDLVVNYNVGPIDIADLRRKTHIIYSTVGETQDLANNGYFIEPASASAAGSDENIYNIRVDETQGLQASGNTSIRRDGAAVLLEQHFYLDLDGDGSYLPYIGTICAASHKLLRLTIGWEADESGTPLDNYKQIQYFTHYKYKNNPDGFYGLGLGHTIADLNSAANIMLRQIMDAATLANDGNMSGFVSERLGLVGDEIRMVLGKFQKIPSTVEDITTSIFQFKFPGPNAALMQLMDAIDQRAQRLGSTTEALTGTPSRAEQSTTYLATIEQGLEAFSSVQMRLSNAFGDELQKVYRINQKYLPLVDYYVVNDEPEQITRADYADDMLIAPIFDPKFTTQSQKVARANAELEATLKNPNNEARPEVVDTAFRRYFEALDVENIDELVPPAPKPEDFDDQITENMFFLMPQETRPLFDVFPHQNHQQHLAELEQFIMQYGAKLDPEQQEAIIKHKMKHEAYLYGQEHGIIEAGQVGASPLAQRQDDQMDNGPIGGAISPSAPAGLASLMGGGAPIGGQAAGNSSDQPLM